MFDHPKALVRAGQLLLASAVLLVAWMQRLEPGLNPTYAPISFYARAQHGWVLLAALLATAIAMPAFSRAYKLVYPQHNGGRPLVWLGVAIALAGVLRAQPYFPWERRPTLEGMLHGVSTLAATLLFTYAAFIIGKELKRRMLVALAATFIGLAAFSGARAAVLLLLNERPQSMGLEERLIFLVGVAWFFVLFPFFGRHKTV